MQLLSRIAAVTAMGAAVLGFSAASASAYIVCSGDDCWHVHERYQYPASAGIIIHEDNWRWAPHAHYRWREHEGRGYWDGGEWRNW